MSWILALGEARLAALWPLAAEMVRPVAAGLVLGVSAAAPIGPVNVELARRALQHGYWAGVALGLGAVTVDVFYAVVSTLSFTAILQSPAIILVMTGTGAALLAYLGVQCLRAARRAWFHDPLGNLDATGGTNTGDAGAPDGRHAARSSYLTGLLMTLLNPLTLGFWFSGALAAGGSVSGVTGDGQIAKAAASDLPMICAGVFIGTAAWVFSFSGLLAWASRRGGNQPGRRRKWLAAADAFGGVTLLAFAVLAFLRLIGSLR